MDNKKLLEQITKSHFSFSDTSLPHHKRGHIYRNDEFILRVEDSETGRLTTEEFLFLLESFSKAPELLKENIELKDKVDEMVGFLKGLSFRMAAGETKQQAFDRIGEYMIKNNLTD
jgi:hypothetical protein